MKHDAKLYGEINPIDESHPHEPRKPLRRSESTCTLFQSLVDVSHLRHANAHA